MALVLGLGRKFPSISLSKETINNSSKNESSIVVSAEEKNASSISSSSSVTTASTMIGYRPRLGNECVMVAKGILPSLTRATWIRTKNQSTNDTESSTLTKCLTIDSLNDALYAPLGLGRPMTLLFSHERINPNIQRRKVTSLLASNQNEENKV